MDGTLGAIKQVNLMEKKMLYEKVDADEIIRKLKRILEILKIKYGVEDETKLEDSRLD